MSIEEVTKELEQEIRNVYNNDEFVMCIMAETKSPVARRKMLSFILTAS